MLGDVNVWPTLSVVMTRRSYEPSASAVVFHATLYGLVVSAAPIVVQVLARARLVLEECALATPEPVSAESRTTVDRLRRARTPLSAGAVMLPVGLCCRRVTMRCRRR